MSNLPKTATLARLRGYRVFHNDDAKLQLFFELTKLFLLNFYQHNQISPNWCAR